MSATPDRSKYMALFQTEAAEHLQKLNESLLQLEQTPGAPEPMQVAFRAAHTLKGSSRLVGLNDIHVVAHRLEDVLGEVRDGRLEWKTELADLMLFTVDAISDLLQSAVSNQPSAIDVQTLCAALEQAARHEPFTLPSPRVQESKSQESKSQDSKTLDSKTLDSKTLDSKTLDSGTPGHRVAQSWTRVPSARLDRLVNQAGTLLIAHGKLERHQQQLKALLNQLQHQSELWQLLLPQPSNHKPQGSEQEDTLTQLRQLHDDTTRSLESALRELKEALEEGELTLSHLQDEMLRMRLEPLSTLFQPFPRAVRDMARELGKEINLQIQGEDNELDRSIMDAVREALMHVVRNAIDHGIEPPDEREALGKPHQGTVTLAARQHGETVVIEVRDDGQGIDPQKVKAAAVEKGIISAARAEELSDRDALDLLFAAGFTTTTTVTALSGRGVGMDVVRQNIRSLKGDIQVETERGKGTTFRLSVPLTLATSRVVLIETGGQLFAVPSVAVRHLLEVSPADIHRVQGYRALVLEDKVVPLVHLADLLGLPRAEPQITNHESPLHVMALGTDTPQAAFIVERFHDEREIVMKNLGLLLEGTPNIAGCTLLGDGGIVLVLHAPDLIHVVRGGVMSAERQIERARQRGKPRILIAEDSMITRELERSILEAEGYEVQVAHDGADALEQLNAADFDLVLTDIEMPRMDGIQLTRAIREDERLRHLPVVVVSSRERDEEKRAGLEAGADAYLVKSAFDHTELLNVIERLIGQ